MITKEKQQQHQPTLSLLFYKNKHIKFNTQEHHDIFHDPSSSVSINTYRLLLFHEKYADKIQGSQVDWECLDA